MLTMIKKLPAAMNNRLPAALLDIPMPDKAPAQKSMHGPIPKQNAKDPKFTRLLSTNRKMQNVVPSNISAALPNVIFNLSAKALSSPVSGSIPQPARTRNCMPAAHTITEQITFMPEISFFFVFSFSITVIYSI